VEIPETSGLPFDLITISPSWNAFVRVKRMPARVTGLQDTEVLSGSGIREPRILTGSAGAVTELRVLLSHTMWQYFRIVPDRIPWIRGDRTPVAPTGQNAVNTRIPDQ
jgi:hypothetical protein